MSKKIAKTLIFLIKSENQKCPPFHFNSTNERQLLTTAKLSKATPYLFHFLNCPACQKKLTRKTKKKLKQLEKQNHFSHLIYQNQMKILNQLFLKNKIKVVFIKNLSFYSLMNLHREYYWGADLDLLIDKKNFKKAKELLLKKNYSIIKKLNYGFTFKTAKIPIEIDLHFLATRPRQNELTFLKEKNILQFSQELLKKAQINRQGYYLLSKEYLLLFLIWHYSTNDVLRGLRNLKDIIQFADKYNKQINWSDFLKLAKRFKLKNLSLFTLQLGSQIFALPFPSKLRKLIKIPFKVNWMLSYFTPEKIAFFPKGQSWSKSKKGKKLLQEHFFLQLIISEAVPLHRLIRPQIITFILSLSFSRLIKKINF